MNRKDTIFYGTIKNKTLVLLDKDRYNAVIGSYPEDTEMQITVGKKKYIRNLGQNAYYWGVLLDTIADETGHTPEELHEIYKKMFIPRRFVKYGDEEVEILKSTTKLTVGEFVEYINKITREAVQLGIALPAPKWRVEDGQ